jgi:transposase-like protein
VIAKGVTAKGGREALDVNEGEFQGEVFRTALLTSRKVRGLARVNLVTSDAY